MKKNYHCDTCALLEQYNTIDVLRNGEENNIFISMTVLNEIDHLMKTNKRNIAIQALDNIFKNKEHITFTGNIHELKSNDDMILNTVYDNNINKDQIFVTNDKMLQLKSYIRGVKSEPFLSTIPFKTESELYTGIVDYYTEDLINNCFFFKEGKLHQYIDKQEFIVPNIDNVWNISPKTIYQNAALCLMLNNDIKVVTIQSDAGFGKSYISLASALKLVFEMKQYSKLYIVKYPSQIGEDMGFLPGSINEKMDLHWKPLYKLLYKLHMNRNIPKGFINKSENETGWPTLNPKKIEFLPVNYLRGDNIDNAVVFIDEAQNITRHDMRTILTRMGENVKVLIAGDVSQIDNAKCNEANNALNWIVKSLKNKEQYGHIILKGKNTRGDICKMILESNL